MTAATADSPVRRSRREKRQAHTVYDDARNSLGSTTTKTSTTAPQSLSTTASSKSRSRQSRQKVKRVTITRNEKKKRTSTDEEESDNDNDDDEEEVSSSSDTDDDDDDNDDEAYDPSNKKSSRRGRTSPRKSPTSKTTTSKTKKTQVMMKPGRKATTTTANARRTKTKTTSLTKRSIQTALASLCRKVLVPDEETPETSLVAALLQSYKIASPTVLEQFKRRHDTSKKNNNATTTATTTTNATTPYTPQLEYIARQVIQQHVQDPNKAQIQLLNLLFRSVGGSYETNLDQKDEDLVLEDMDHEQWGDIITTIVDEMRHTPLDSVLLCADPQGAAHANAILQLQQQQAATSDGDGHHPTTTATETTDHLTATGSVGVREYRKIYQEFWRVFGDVALSETIISSSSSTTVPTLTHSDNDDDDDDSSQDNNNNNNTTTTTSRFNTELVSDVVNRLIELVSVGQPDVRAAATIATLQLGHAILDRTLVLQQKLDLAKRQFAAATKQTTKTKQQQQRHLTPKAQSIQHQMEDVQRTMQDLQEIVVGPIIQGVFMHRYRDSNYHIRTMCIQSLSHMSIQRPDTFITNKYLKYFGWMLNDKADVVRIASLEALLAPFGSSNSGNDTNTTTTAPMDVSLLEGIIGKFRSRIVDCLMDISPFVQEKAMALLLALLREGFLDDIEENDFWTKINLMAITKETTPRTRRDALYFIMEQLEPFDDGEDNDDDDDSIESDDEDSDKEEQGRQRPKASQKQGKRWSKETNASLAQSTERTAALRIESLASWTAHALTDGSIPIEKIRVELVDFIVHSLRDMPEHKDLATNWSAMLRAISDDSPTTTSKSNATMTDDIEDSHRLDSAKERILVQMLASAAHAQVGVIVNSSFLAKDLDSDYLEAMSSITTTAAAALTESKKKDQRSRIGRGGSAVSKDGGILHESLSVALLESLPKLMRKFKSDPAILGSLSGLPRYLLPSVLSLPQRKKDFTALMKILSEIYLETVDEIVLQNTALSLTSLSKGDHARAVDARLHLQRITVSLRDRIVELLDNESEAESSTAKKKKRRSTSRRTSSSRKRRRSARQSSQSSQSTTMDDSDNEDETMDDDNDERSKMVDVESAIYLCLKRFRVLSKRCNIADILESVSGVSVMDDEDNGIQSISNAIVKGMDKRLADRKIKVEETEMEEEEIKVTIPEIWTRTAAATGGSDDDKIHNDKSSVHAIVAKSIHEALSFLLSIAAWQIAKIQEDDAVLAEKENKDDNDVNMDEDDNDEADVEDHILVQLRKQMVALLELCFENFLHDTDNILDHTGQEVDEYSKEHIAYADSVQLSASSVAGDLRALFLKEWEDAASPILRGCALSDDTRLIGPSVRYFRSKEEALRAQEGKDEEDIAFVQSLLLPLSRGITMNWTKGNRREAGVALAHLTGSGTEGSALVSTMSRLLKKIEPVRLLEAHMASLRQSYEDWMDNEPEDLDEEGTPTDEEMAAFEESEKKHAEMFQVLDHQAARLSNSLGVGKLSDSKLTPALLGFVREGVRFAFSNSEAGDEEDDLLLGGRLTFLIILARYVGWIRKNKDQKVVLQQDVNQRERDLRSHDDFEEVHEDDLKALADFRSTLGLEPWGANHVSDGDDEDNSLDEQDNRMTPNSTSSRSTGMGSRRFSRGASSIGGGSSVASKRSKMSAQSSLSPVSEEDDTIASDDEEDLAAASPSHAKRKEQKRKHKNSQRDQSLSSKTSAKSQITIDEESDEDEDSLLSPRRETPKKASGKGGQDMSTNSKRSIARSEITIDEESDGSL